MTKLNKEEIKFIDKEIKDEKSAIKIYEQRILEKMDKINLLLNIRARLK
jgi:hypothetical protein